MKKCSKCGQEKELSEFHLCKRNTDGRRQPCKSCTSEINKADREKPGRREIKNAQQRKRYRENPNLRARILAKSKVRRRADHLKHKFGLTVDDVETLQQGQGNRCAICGCEFSTTPHIDHCHTTGKVRGLLCSECNLGLGKFNDDPQRLRQAAMYLENQ